MKDAEMKPETTTVLAAADYTILHAYTSGDLIGQVNAMMATGYRPVGGVCYSAAEGDFFQAMLFPANVKDQPRT